MATEIATTIFTVGDLGVYYPSTTIYNNRYIENNLYKTIKYATYNDMAGNSHKVATGLEYHTSSTISNSNIKWNEYISDITTGYIAGDYIANNITWGDGSNLYWTEAKPLPAGEQLRQIIAQRLAPAIHLRRRRILGIAQNVQEERARATLRRVLGEVGYRNFLSKGCVTVRAASGLWYRIFPGHDMTEVYDRGEMVDKLCVVMAGSFPPTDSLIMRYLLILNDEEEFRGYAIKHSVSRTSTTITSLPKQESLPAIFAQLKAVA